MKHHSSFSSIKKHQHYQTLSNTIDHYKYDPLWYIVKHLFFCRHVRAGGKPRRWSDVRSRVCPGHTYLGTAPSRGHPMPWGTAAGRYKARKWWNSWSVYGKNGDFDGKNDDFDGKHGDFDWIFSSLWPFPNCLPWKIVIFISKSMKQLAHFI